MSDVSDIEKHSPAICAKKNITLLHTYAFYFLSVFLFNISNVTNVTHVTNPL
jgi:hypothetical protein